jgi:hypothetical protein
MKPTCSVHAMLSEASPTRTPSAVRWCSFFTVSEAAVLIRPYLWAWMKLIHLVLFSLLVLAGCGRRETTLAPSQGTSGKEVVFLPEARRGFKTNAGAW